MLARNMRLAGAALLVAAGTLGTAAAQPAQVSKQSVRANSEEAMREADPLREFESNQSLPDVREFDEDGTVRGQASIDFDDDLYLQNDLMMQGITAHETLVFTVPEAWDLQEDPELTLHYEHSALLSAPRSTLSIRLNGSGVGSVRLDASNVALGVLKVRLPRHLLRDYNELKLSVVQHIDDECEDPFDPALWTRVTRESFIRISYVEQPIAAELGEFPRPLLDPLSYGPVHVALAGAPSASQAQLDALSEVAFALGRHASYRGVVFDDPVSSLSAARDHVLVVGTPADNPLVSSLLTRRPGAGEGVVAVMPRDGDPSRAVVLVAGGDAAGLAKAASALGSKDLGNVLSGPISVVESVSDSEPPATQTLPLPVPDEDEFALVEMGIGDTTVRGYYAPPIKIPLKMDGDTQVQVDGARVGLDYAYSAYLDTRLSTMEVRLNGVTIRSMGLTDPEGAERDRVWVDLPFDLIEPNSELEIVFHLFPRDFGECVYITDTHIWGTVFSSTNLRLFRDHYTQLPNLALLRHDLWPYNQRADEGSLVVTTDNDPTLWDATAAAQMVAELGRRSTGRNASVRIQAGGGELRGSTAGADLIVLTGAGPNTLYDQLVRSGDACLQGDQDRALRCGANELRAEVSGRYGTLEQVVLNPQGRTALVAHAPSDESLPDLVRTLQDESKLRSLGGSLAVVHGEASRTHGIKTLEVRDTQQIGSVPLRSRLQRTLRDSWWALGIAVLLAAFLLSLLLRGWAERHGGQA